MKPHASAPVDRVCRAGCEPLPQPIGNFYSRVISERGIRLYDYTCKRCLCAREKRRYAALPKGPAKPRGGRQEKMRPLVGRDVIACPDCGLRGHARGDEERCIVAQQRSTGLGGRGTDWAL